MRPLFLRLTELWFEERAIERIHPRAVRLQDDKNETIIGRLRGGLHKSVAKLPAAGAGQSTRWHHLLVLAKVHVR